MKKILQLGMTQIYGGTEAYLIHQYREINKNKYKYEFISMLNSDVKICFEDEIKEHSSVIKLPFDRKHHPIKTYLRWLLWMKKNASRYDALVYNINGLNISFPVLAYKIFGSGEVIIHSHNSGEMDGNDSLLLKTIRLVNKFIINQVVDKRLACSKLAGRYIFGNKKNIQIIHNGIEINKYKFNPQKRSYIRSQYGLDNCLVLGHVGRFSYQKNQEFLLDVIYNLHKKDPRTILFMIGDQTGNPELAAKVYNIIEERKMQEYVIIESPKMNLNEYYSAFDVFLLPSRFEGLPLVGIEAQTAGLRSFFSDTISREVAITPFSNFLGIDDDSVNEWVNSILSQKYPYDRESAPDFVKKAGYDLHDQIIKIEEIYKKL